LHALPLGAVPIRSASPLVLCLLYPHQMVDLGNHATNRRTIIVGDLLVQTSQTQSLYGHSLVCRITDIAFHPGNA
jgi:hypothetical protein